MGGFIVGVPPSHFRMTMRTPGITSTLRAIAFPQGISPKY